jgi:hypothetical protein
MATRSIEVFAIVGTLCILIPFTLIAQVQRDIAPLGNWAAPLYWQPSAAESQANHVRVSTSGEARLVSSAADITQQTTPAAALVFVAMTPCRIADTRDGTFPAGFGPPSLVGGTSRTFAIQSLSSLCPVPSIAQAYSFNITVVPPGTTFPGTVNPSGALGHLTIWPTGVPQPVVSTLNSFLGTVVANAAIVPAGSSGSVDVFVSQSTDLIIDINGYYAPQTGITLAQGSASAPPMSFAGDSGTGIFSSGAGSLNIATGGSPSVSVTSNGNVGIGTNTPVQKLDVESSAGYSVIRAGSKVPGNGAFMESVNDLGPTVQVTMFGSASAGQNFGLPRANLAMINTDTYSSATVSAFAIGSIETAPLILGTVNSERMRIDTAGNVGIGTSTPGTKLDVSGPVRSTTGGFIFPDGTVQGTAATGSGVTSLNGATGAVSLAQGTGITISRSENTITISGAGGPGGVSSLNALTGAVTLAPGPGISLSPSGNTITISGAPVCTTAVYNFNGTTDLTKDLFCPANYTAISGQCGGAPVIQGQSPDPPTGGSWLNYLIPNVNNATGVHCAVLSAGSPIQANVRCCR